MRGFKENDAAGRFCREHDELNNFLRTRSRYNQYVPAARRSRRSLRQARIVIGIMQIAWSEHSSSALRRNRRET
jgi:putative transposase